MIEKCKPPPGAWLWWSVALGSAALAILARAVLRGEAVHEGFISPWLLIAAALAVNAVGFWFVQGWARGGSLAVMLAAALYAIGAMIFDESVLSESTLAAFLLIGAAVLWRWPPIPPDEMDEPYLSLVLLFREPHYLDASILAQLASSAWDVEVEVVEEDDEPRDPEAEGEPPPTLVGGAMPHFFCFHAPAFFTIYCFDEPYFDDPADVAESVREMRARQAVAEHRAWLSVDLVQWMGEDMDREEAYRLIGRLLAELADENCLAVLDPVEGRVYVYDPDTERKLRSDSPLAELQELFYAPIATINGDDAEMQAAVEEARRRWPEFVAAFEDRPECDEAPFLIKAPFYHDEAAEYMWVKVTGIENRVIYGRLGNAPANIPHLREGTCVRVKEEDVNDWMCIVQGKPRGGFTLKVLGRSFEDD